MKKLFALLVAFSLVGLSLGCNGEDTKDTGKKPADTGKKDGDGNGDGNGDS